MSALEGLAAGYRPPITKPVTQALARRIASATISSATVGKVFVDLADVVGLRKLNAAELTTNRN